METLMQSHQYSAKSKAKRAALSKLGENAVEGVHFELQPVGDEGKYVYVSLQINERSITREAAVENRTTPFSTLFNSFTPNGAVKGITSTKVVDGKKLPNGTSEAPAKKVSAKAFIRAVFEKSPDVTLERLLSAGYTESNIRTALSDLKNEKYAGGVTMEIHSEVRDTVRYYVLGTK